MAGHGPAVKLGKDNASSAKAKLGIVLFFVYALFYGAFVFLNVLYPEVMARPAALGLNLAVFYGFGLIVIAMVMGLVYNRICTRYEDQMNRQKEEA